MIFLGCMMATKASASTFVIVVATMLVHIFYMKHTSNIKRFMWSLPISIAIFILSYIVFFIQGNTLREFLGVQKWILNFYTIGAKGDPSAALQILFIGNWPTWWGQVLKVNEWTIMWPLVSLATVYYLYVVLSKHKLYPSILFGIWSVIYLAFLAFVPVWPRYLLLLLPFMYTLFVWVLSKKIRWFSSD